MKLKRNGFYEGSNANVRFIPETFQAFSYQWWQFTMPYRGGVIFNRYGYSMTTIKHQYKVRALLDRLGIKIVEEVEAPHGLQGSLGDAAEFHRLRALRLIEETKKPGTRKEKNRERLKQAKEDERLAALLWRLHKKRMGIEK